MIATIDAVVRLPNSFPTRPHSGCYTSTPDETYNYRRAQLHTEVHDVTLGGKIPASQLGEQDLAAFRERERLEMLGTIASYVDTCGKITTGNPIPKGISHSANSIQQGIVEVISQNRAGRLIMGAGTDTGYSSGMEEPTSTKAIYVRQHAPKYCQLQFICWGKLICTREGVEPSNPDTEQRPSDVLGINEPDTGPESRSNDSLYDQLEQAILKTGYSLSRQKAEIEDICQEYLAEKLCDLELERDEALVEAEQLRKQLAEGQCDLELERDAALEEAEQLRKQLAERLRNLELESDEALVEAEQLSCQLAEGLCDLELERVEALEEAEQLRKQLAERLRNLELERDEALVEAEQLRKQLAERLYDLELKRYEASEEAEQLRKQLAERMCDLNLVRDEALEEAEQLRKELAERLCDLNLERDEALEEAEQLRKQLAERLRDLELKRHEASEEAEQLRKQQAERLCDLKLERDEALEEAEQLRKQLAKKRSTFSTPRLFSKFSTSDIKKATNNFNLRKIIGQGGFGFIYKGLLGHTEVAIKVLHPESKQGPREFQREMNALSNLRHPNLVTLVGACLESRALIYQYLHGGSLEDRLNCKDNSPPLSWQTRIRIAIELCSVVAFLHSNAPNIIIHGDLKPANILLDENFVCKLSDFGICHMSPRTGENLTIQNTSFFTTPRGTISYMDPEFLTTGVLSKKSDVYSVGVILLRLLTGKPPLGIAKKVTNALKSGTLKSILDPLAGKWPSVQAEELTAMALLCCEMTKQNRPDVTKVWRFLKLIKASWIGLSTHEWVCDVEPPTHFLCPIFQEIMQDPHIAADGFTYEKDAIRDWLDIVGNLSPMTKVALRDSNLVPNHALKSAIQEWILQNHTVQ